MTASLQALLIRYLRNSSRELFTYLLRVAMVLLVWLLFLFLARRKILGSMPSAGAWHFAVLAYLDFSFIVLGAMGYFARAITEEKENMTLGLLRLTALDPFSILLWKSMRGLCPAVLLLIAQFPLTMVMVMMGGITPWQILWVDLVLVAFLVFLSSVALFTSVISRRVGDSVGLTIFALLLFLFMGPIAGALGQVPVVMKWAPEENLWARLCNLLSEFGNAASPIYGIQRVIFPPKSLSGVSGRDLFQVASNLGLGVGFLLLAWRAFDLFCDEPEQVGPPGVKVPPVWRGWRLWRPNRVWTRAVDWKEFYFTCGGKPWVVGKLVIYGGLLVLLCFARVADARFVGKWDILDAIGPIALGFPLICGYLELMAAASSMFRNEHVAKTLAALAMLPQGFRWVTSQKLRGVAAGLFPAGIYLLLGLILFTPSVYRDRHHDGLSFGGALLIAFFAAQLLLFLYLMAGYSVGAKRGARALAVIFEIVILFLAGATFNFWSNHLWAIGLATLLTLAVTAYLHAGIGWRLEELAGEG